MTMPPAALLLFRLGGRGYASPRERVLGIVDVGAQPPVPGLPSSTLAALDGNGGLLPLVSLRVALGLPDLGAEGRILVVSTNHGPTGFLVDEVVQALGAGPERPPDPRPREPPGHWLRHRHGRRPRRHLAAGQLGRDPRPVPLGLTVGPWRGDTQPAFWRTRRFSTMFSSASGENGLVK